MEFLMKLTRPARNTSGGGFSFTKPPISHIRLGDWFDSDIVINSVGLFILIAETLGAMLMLLKMNFFLVVVKCQDIILIICCFEIFAWQYIANFRSTIPSPD
jgi:hypothetical protein